MFESKEDDDLLWEYQKHILFHLRLNALQAAWAVGSGYRHVNSTKETDFQKVAERLIRDLIREGVPSELDAEYWKKVLDYYLYISSVAMRPGGADVDEMFAKRQEFIKLVTKNFSSETLTENQTSWKDALPMDLLSKVCHTVRIATAFGEH